MTNTIDTNISFIAIAIIKTAVGDVTTVATDRQTDRITIINGGTIVTLWARSQRAIWPTVTTPTE